MAKLNIKIFSAQQYLIYQLHKESFKYNHSVINPEHNKLPAMAGRPGSWANGHERVSSFDQFLMGPCACPLNKRYEIAYFQDTLNASQNSWMIAKVPEGGGQFTHEKNLVMCKL